MQASVRSGKPNLSPGNPARRPAPTKPNLDSIRSESDRIGSLVSFFLLEGSRAFSPCRYSGATAGGLGESLDGRQEGILDNMERRVLSGLSARCGGLRRRASMACWSLPRRLRRSTARACLRLRSHRQKRCVGNTNGHLAQLQTLIAIPLLGRTRLAHVQGHVSAGAF